MLSNGDGGVGRRRRGRIGRGGKRGGGGMSKFCGACGGGCDGITGEEEGASGFVYLRSKRWASIRSV